MKKWLTLLWSALLLYTTPSCKNNDHHNMDPFIPPQNTRGVFIIHEGQFQHGNASLSYYLPDEKKIFNNIFYRNNQIPLGDVAQSMSLHGNSGYLTINNSNKIYAINTRNIKVTGDITGLHTPRYIHIVNDEKAYVTSGSSHEISIFNPKTFKIIKKINTAPYTTEKIIQDNDTKRIFVSTSWNSNKEVHNNKILVIDPQTDTLEKSIETKANPTGGIQIHINKKLWALQVSWDSQSYLTRIDLSTDEKLHILLPTGIRPSRLSINASKNTLYWIAGNRIWRMSVNETTAPTEAFISPTQAQTIYGLGIDPKNEDIYVVDALDYQQSGKLYRYSSNTRELIDSVTTGILPQAFAFPSFN